MPYISRFAAYSLILLSLTTRAEFRDYPQHQDNPISHFYYMNRTQHTLDFVLNKKEEFIGTTRVRMTVWEALEFLNTLVDESDPDLQLPQIVHCIQTAEAIRKDGHPRWLVLMGLIHDLGKILCLFGELQWAVVGDTFPVGCAYSPTCIYYDFFKENPDMQNPLYQTKYGIYTPHCGLENVHFSWGHDEYLYQRLKNYLSVEAGYVIRYHSFYPQHQHNGYDHLLNDIDQEMFKWVKLFQTYDLYSKNQNNNIDIEALTPYYKELVHEFFPDPIDW